jgi:uncharacterized membrane protein YphA (DoxX/SURF4 family)
MRWTRWRGHAWVALPLRWYLAWVFAIACAHKIADPASFALDIAMYGILPTALINAAAITLPWVELAAALMLALGLRTRAAAAMVSGMMTVFLVALLTALARGLDMGCGCFASDGGDDPISWRTVVRDLIWLGMALWVLALDRRPLGLDRLLDREEPDA